jgi:hypothetical protein
MMSVLLMIPAFAVNLIGQELTVEPLVWQLLNFVLGLIILTIVFYIAGRIVVGKKRALFSDAFVISLLGTIVMNVCLNFFGLLVGAILSLIVWLLLVKHYYETGWLGAIAVGIMAVIVSIVILVILGLFLTISFFLLGSFALFLIF